MIRTLFISSACLTLVACAKAELTIQADLYNADTRESVSQRQNEELARLTAATSSIRLTKTEATKCGANVKDLSQTMEDVVIAYQQLIFEITPPASRITPTFSMAAARNPFLLPRSRFTNAVDAAVQDVKTKADGVITTYMARAEALNNVNYVVVKDEVQANTYAKTAAEQNLIFAQSVHDLDNSFYILATYIASNDSYAVALRSSLDKISGQFDGLLAGNAGALGSLNATQISATKSLANKINGLTAKLESNTNSCIRVPFNVTQGMKNDVAQMLANPTRTGLQRSLPALVTSLQTIAAPDEGGNAAISGIRDLARNQDFYLSQLDRLQDPADPTWREILDPNNANNWSTLFARTKFRAKGDADVIVVRDRPGHYRVQRGTNNPAALIQGQLEISRSLASATTSIIGAMSGVRVPLVAEGQQAAGQGSDGDGSGGAQPAAPANATASARVEAEVQERAARARNAARDALSVQIQLAIRDLQAVQDDAALAAAAKDAARDQIYARLAPVLESYAALLEFNGIQETD